MRRRIVLAVCLCVAAAICVAAVAVAKHSPSGMIHLNAMQEQPYGLSTFFRA